MECCVSLKFIPDGGFSDLQGIIASIRGGSLHLIQPKTQMELGKLGLVQSEIFPESPENGRFSLKSGLASYRFDAGSAGQKLKLVEAMNRVRADPIVDFFTENELKKSVEGIFTQHHLLELRTHLARLEGPKETLEAVIACLDREASMLARLAELLGLRINPERTQPESNEENRSFSSEWDDCVTVGAGRPFFARSELALLPPPPPTRPSCRELPRLESFRGGPGIFRKQFSLAANPILSREDFTSLIGQASVRKLLASNTAFKRFPVFGDTSDSRDSLPSQRDCDEPMSLLQLVRAHLGKDLSIIATPVIFSEGLSETQRLIDNFEYHDALTRAAECDDKFLRLAYILSMVLINYRKIIYRRRRNFTPLMGETSEFVWGDARGVAEQVSASPPVAAWHVESKTWEADGDQRLTLNIGFSGIEVEARGAFRIKLKTTGEVFEVTRPKGSVRNLVFGRMYAWLSSPLIVACPASGDSATVNFAPRSGKPENDYFFEGAVRDKEGKIRYRLDGRWNEAVFVTNPETNIRTELIRAKPLPKNARFNGYFSDFSLNLNHLTPKQCFELPKTDSRFRPDLRAFDHGDLDLAEAEKDRLEELQKIRTGLGKGVKPQWFSFQETDQGIQTKYLGTYWQTRESKAWPSGTPDLFF